MTLMMVDVVLRILGVLLLLLIGLPVIVFLAVRSAVQGYYSALHDNQSSKERTAKDGEEETETTRET